MYDVHMKSMLLHVDYVFNAIIINSLRLQWNYLAKNYLNRDYSAERESSIRFI